MECKFTVGQKVVCIDDKHHPELLNGNVYTITDIELDGKTCLLGTISLHPDNVVLSLKGVSHVEYFFQENGHTFMTNGWCSHIRFRPLQSHKTDISIFTSMLTPTTAKRKTRAPV